eukprot:EW703598.1.p2 GENE.EW703598.1~~EW703598.1.p2  ORF type:complete len:75 (+),score=8.41 EW703598.1:63-287(+)
MRLRSAASSRASDLEISLNNYDPDEDKGFRGVLRLDVVRRRKYGGCLLGDAEHEGEAKGANIQGLTADDLGKLI